MIVEGLWTLLLGMVGIFLVMGFLVLVLMFMNRIAKRWVKKEED